MEAYYKHLGEPQWRQDSLWSPAAHNLPSDTGIAWIDNVAYAAKSASLHVALLALSLIWTGASLRHSRQGRTATALPKASQISFAYELPSQLARSAALAFTIVAAVRGQSSQWYNVLLLGYAFLLGLTRLANNLQWRHVALHQVNYLIGACLLMLVLGELLPTLVIASTYRPSAMVVGAIVSLVVAILVALWTPREWAPPPVSFHLIQRPADAGPAPEEVCSWWTLYWTFEWLTPLVWKGVSRCLPRCIYGPRPHGASRVITWWVSKEWRTWADHCTMSQVVVGKSTWMNCQHCRGTMSRFSSSQGFKKPVLRISLHFGLQ